MARQAIVVGTSFGCITHVRALRAAGMDVAALVGRDPARTAARAERFDVAVASTSLTEALALPDVDAVTIATPPHTHRHRPDPHHPGRDRGRERQPPVGRRP